MKTALNLLKDSLDNQYDVFIVSASFEERCLSVVKALEGHVSFNHKLVSASEHNKELIENNLNIFIGKGFDSFEVSNLDQIKTVINLSDKINGILEEQPDASFLVDITTFTRQTILIMMRLLRNALTSMNKIKFVYVPAQEYSPGIEDEKKWLTKGILKVNSVFGYSGIIRPSRPYHLIILLGFEVERAASLIAAYEPSKITIGYANEKSSKPEHYKINKQRFEELLAEYPNAERFEFSCGDILGCKNEILNVVKKHEGYNVVVSPMNNKITAASSALAAFDDEKIQLAIAIPTIYNFDYSIGATSCHILDIPDFIKTDFAQ